MNSDQIKSYINNNIVCPGRVTYNELSAHGIPVGSTFVWKRDYKSKLTQDYQGYLDLAKTESHQNDLQWYDVNFVGEEDKLILRIFLLQNVLLPKVLPQNFIKSEFELPDCFVMIFTDKTDEKIIAWVFNVD